MWLLGPGQGGKDESTLLSWYPWQDGGPGIVQSPTKVHLGSGYKAGWEGWPCPVITDCGGRAKNWGGGFALRSICHNTLGVRSIPPSLYEVYLATWKWSDSTQKMLWTKDSITLFLVSVLKKD